MCIYLPWSGGPGSTGGSQSSSHGPRRGNNIDTSSTKENVISGRKTPSGNVMESPKVLMTFLCIVVSNIFTLSVK